MLQDVENILEEIKDQWNNNEIKNMLNVLERREESQTIEKDRSRKMDIGIDCLQKILPTCRKKCLHCTICNSLYIPVVNSFSICLICEQEVCSNCILLFKSPADMELCRVCYIKRLQKLKSGIWFNEISDVGKGYEFERNLSVIKNEIKTTVQSDEENSHKYKTTKPLTVSMWHGTKSQTRSNQLKDDYEESSIGLSSNSTQSVTETVSGHSGAVKNDPHKTLDNSNRLSNSQRKESSVVSSTLSSSNTISQKRPLNNRKESINDYSKESSVASSPFISSYPNTRPTTKTQSPLVNGYKKESDLELVRRKSLYSICRKSLNTTEVVGRGEIEVSLKYLTKLSKFQVTIIQCKDLSNINCNDDSSNIYIVVYLLPDKSSDGKRKTSNKRRSLNPIYEEILSYRIDRVSLSSRTLNLTVWHTHEIYDDIYIGESNLPLANINFSNFHRMWLPLQTRDNVPNLVSHFLYKGELLVGLRYDASSKKIESDSNSEFNNGKLILYIKHGRNIGNSKNAPSTYVKCKMSYKETKKSVHKTQVVNQTTNPVWDKQFCYEEIDKKDLFDTKIELVVVSKLKMSKESMLGKLILTKECSEIGTDRCRESDVLFWIRFLEAPDSTVIQDYLHLRGCLD